MNILLLTPDASGGTLLRSLITLYASCNDLDTPYVDVSHLELGLHKETNSQGLELVRHHSEYENYNQSLTDIVQLLESVDHHKIAKISQYNMGMRSDSSAELSAFYRYLNENFLIISCRRQSKFDYALSWAINKITSRLNVFSHSDKFESFGEYYENKITIDPLVLTQALDDYSSYITWCETNFDVDRVYYYERDVEKIEQFILDLPIFDEIRLVSNFQDQFGIKFNDWNRCHYYKSNITDFYKQRSNYLLGNLAKQSYSTDNEKIQNLQQQNQQWLADSYAEVAGEDWPSIQSVDEYLALSPDILTECSEKFGLDFYINKHRYYSNILDGTYTPPVDLRTDEQRLKIDPELLMSSNQNFVDTHNTQYQHVMDTVKQLVEQKIMSKPIPIKKQTLADKYEIIENFNECMEVYNAWAHTNESINQADIETKINLENATWRV